jgi:hypothetical protein
MENQKEVLIRSLENNRIEEKNPQSNQSLISFLHFFSYLGLAILLGIFFGFLLTKLPFKNELKKSSRVVSSQKTAGIIDKKTFKDQAEGTLKEGGIDGEGNFHLERPGGVSQNVYLTSSTVDLSLYVEKKVRVYGQTFAGQKAGWLMDVGLVEVLE